jgi:alpha-N-arabinofuranosidase
MDAQITGCYTFSSGAALHPSTIQLSNYDQLLTSAITWNNSQDGNTYLKIKVVSFSHWET